jgi:hypothetical protein
MVKKSPSQQSDEWVSAGCFDVIRGPGPVKFDVVDAANAVGCPTCRAEAGVWCDPNHPVCSRPPDEKAYHGTHAKRYITYMMGGAACKLEDMFRTPLPFSSKLRQEHANAKEKARWWDARDHSET